MEKLTIKQLWELLECDPNTGTLTWKPRDASWFKTDNAFKTWNVRFAGKEALIGRNGQGYKCGIIMGRRLKAHRVIFAMMSGRWPTDQIDHINGIRDDNRISNLRDVSKQENMRNACLPSHNTSGCVGVHWFGRTKKWHATIKVSSKQIHLGYFTRQTDAISARKAAEKKYGFHPNHGRDPQISASAGSSLD